MPPGKDSAKQVAPAAVQTPTAQRRSATDGPVQRALRGLGFAAGQKLLSPDGGGRPGSGDLAKGASSVAQRKAALIVSTFGESEEALARGLKETGAERDTKVHRALERQVKEPAAVRRAVLGNMLVRTGRSDGPARPGTMGGSPSALAKERAETSAGVVLAGIEKGTQSFQKQNAPGAALAHPVSAHGKGSDQLGRLLHGRRGDELKKDATDAPTETVTLGGNAHGLGDITLPEYETVGDAPSNAAGAFTTNQGMLHVVGEAFAQADMVSRHAASEAGDGLVDRSRFVSNVAGTGEELGYNVTVPDTGKQNRGATLSKDEMAVRYQRVKRTDGLKNATVVLDPAHVGDRRVGWTLQTAYANNGPLSPSYAKPADVAGGLHEVEARKRRSDERVKSLEKEVEEARGQLAAADGPIRGMKAGLAKRQAALDALVRDGRDVPDRTRKGVDDLKARIQAFEDRKAELAAKVQGLAQTLRAATDAQKQAAQELRKVRATLPRQPTTAKAPTSGYDAATGLWKGDRPAKPDDNPSLRGHEQVNGQRGDPLTAHHLYPWNEIERDLNDALGSRDAGKMKKLMAFGEIEAPVYPDFWADFQKEPTDRSYLFAEEVNRMAQRICWSPSNIFMGPLGSKRGDDPGEDLDQAYVRSGLPTPATALAELTKKKGGIGTSDKLVAKLSANVREAQGGEARAYDPAEWKTDGDGKLVRRHAPKKKPATTP